MPKKKEHWTEVCLRQALEQLNPKRREFVLFYAESKNGTQSAIKAGYSVRSAKEIASELLTFPNVALAVEAALERRMYLNGGMTSDEILEGYSIIAKGDIANYQAQPDGSVTTIPGVPKSATRAIQSVEIKQRFDKDTGEYVGLETNIKLEPRKNGLDALAKYRGLDKECVVQPHSQQTFAIKLVDDTAESEGDSGDVYR